MTYLEKNRAAIFHRQNTGYLHYGECVKKINMLGISSIVAMLALAVFLQMPVQAQTWRMASGIPVVVENAACNSAKDTGGVNAARTVWLMCQSNLWKAVSAGTGGTGGGSSCPPPAPFAFEAQEGVLPTTPTTSNQITVSGTTCPAVLSVSGGIAPQCSVNSGPFTTCGGYLAPGDTLIVRQNAGDDNTQTNMTVTIAGVSAIFSVKSHIYRWTSWIGQYLCSSEAYLATYLAGSGTYQAQGTACLQTQRGATMAERLPPYDAVCDGNPAYNPPAPIGLYYSYQSCQ